jgi:hypothetical protein
MSKSGYEIYCDREQPKILDSKSVLSLAETIEKLKDYKIHFSQLFYEGMVSMAATIYKRQESEIEDLVAGKTYWMI